MNIDDAGLVAADTWNKTVFTLNKSARIIGVNFVCSGGSTVDGRMYVYLGDIAAYDVANHPLIRWAMRFLKYAGAAYPSFDFWYYKLLNILLPPGEYSFVVYNASATDDLHASLYLDP